VGPTVPPAKVGEVLTIRSSDTDTYLPTVLAEFFTRRHNRIAASKWQDFGAIQLLDLLKHVYGKLIVSLYHLKRAGF
jgi:hypothetical protein